MNNRPKPPKTDKGHPRNLKDGSQAVSGCALLTEA